MCDELFHTFCVFLKSHKDKRSFQFCFPFCTRFWHTVFLGKMWWIRILFITLLFLLYQNWKRYLFNHLFLDLFNVIQHCWSIKLTPWFFLFKLYSWCKLNEDCIKWGMNFKNHILDFSGNWLSGTRCGLMPTLGARV